MSEQRTGAQIMCEALIREGVEVMFGIPGGAIMPFYYAMWEYRDQLRHVLCRHEQGAGHAAEGYARSTGRIGVCIGTSGPGTTNLVTPIADAMMDSTSLLAITGQVSSAVLGKDAFQETDITGITMPITKHNYLVKNVEELPYVFKEAIHIATTGRPGPVLIDVTKDTMQAKTVPNWDIKLNLPGYKPNYHGNRKQIREAIRLLTEAKKPLIMAGNGVTMSGAIDELRELAERTGIPVTTTLHGIGSFPEDHPLSIGMPGMHGWVHVNRAIQECDVLLNIGGRFDDRVTGKAIDLCAKRQGHSRRYRPERDRQERQGDGADRRRRAQCAARAARGTAGARGPGRAARPRQRLDGAYPRDASTSTSTSSSISTGPRPSQLMPHDVYAVVHARS